MWTSCNIDVLVHEEDLARVGEAMTQHCGYRQGGKSLYDVALHAPTDSFRHEMTDAFFYFSILHTCQDMLKPADVEFDRFWIYGFWNKSMEQIILDGINCFHKVDFGSLRM